MRRIVSLLVTLGALAAPAFADSYPVSGRWGVTASTKEGPIDCTGLRVIAFNGNQRTDSNGGVPAYRNRTVKADGPSRWRIVDAFTTGPIYDAHVNYTLRRLDNDRIELAMQKGGTLTLRKCR